MPSYTLGELMSNATANAGRRADVAASTVSRLVNEAYFEMWYAVMPEEGEKIAVSSTTTGENKIELPSDCFIPYSAALIWSTSTSTSDHSSYMTLAQVSIEAMDARNPQPSGMPSEVAFFNSWMELWPSPNSAYPLQLRYAAHPSDMTLSTTVPSLSTEWRPALQIKAEEKIRRYVSDGAGADAASIRYLQMTSAIADSKEKRQRNSFRHHVQMQPSTSRGRRRV